MDLADATLLPSAAYITFLDILCGILLVLCCLLGVLGNILAMLYFWSKARDLPTLLYLLTAANDVILCAMNVCSGIALLNRRHATLFHNHAFCAVWDTTHFDLVKLSVMLVLIICVNRTVAVLRPLTRKTRTAKYRTMVFLCAFAVFVIAVDMSQRLLGWGESSYVAHDAYCWMTAVPPPNTTTPATSLNLPLLNSVPLNASPGSNSTLGGDNAEVSNEDNLIYFYIFGAVLLAMPVIPISLASVFTITRVRSSITTVKSNRTGKNLKKHATITTVIFTTAYIIFNIPLFLNYTFWTGTLLFDVDLFDKIYNQDEVMFMYSWHFTDVLCVSLNATVNPGIYFWRIAGFRAWCRSLVRFLPGRVWSAPSGLVRAKTLPTGKGNKSPPPRMFVRSSTETVILRRSMRDFSRRVRSFKSKKTVYCHGKQLES